MRRDISAVAVALALASSVSARQGAATSSMAGAVVDAGGQALAGASVRISDPKTSFEASVIVATNGAFQFDKLAPGRYALTASVDGYVSMDYGAFQAGDQGIPVLAVAGRKISNLIITLRKGSAISGQVMDDRGEPLTGHVSILVPGPQGMRTVIAGSTDGAGRYRFADLSPGAFAVLAVPDSSPRELRIKDASGVDRLVVRTPTFYPTATTFVGASLVTLVGDDEARGIDIQVQSVPATSVEISLTSVGGRPLDRVQAVLISDDDRGPARAQWAQDPDASAKATITGVIAGQYQLVVTGVERIRASAVSMPAGDLAQRAQALDDIVRQLRADPPGQEWAVRHLFVDGVTPVSMSVALEAGASLECLATFDGDEPPSRPAPIQVPNQPRQLIHGSVPVRLKPIDSDWPKSMEPGPESLPLSGNVPLSIRGMVPGRYVLRVADVVGTSLKSLKAARLNGVDVLDLAIELRGGETTSVSLTVTDRQSEIKGTVTDADGRLRLDVAVVIFPRDNRYWIRGTRRIVTTRPDTSGAYEVRGLPGGEYLVATVAERPPEDLSDAQWLNGLVSAAIRLAVIDGGRHVQDLKVGR